MESNLADIYLCAATLGHHDIAWSLFTGDSTSAEVVDTGGVDAIQQFLIDNTELAQAAIKTAGDTQLDRLVDAIQTHPSLRSQFGGALERRGRTLGPTGTETLDVLAAVELGVNAARNPTETNHSTLWCHWLNSASDDQLVDVIAYLHQHHLDTLRRIVEISVAPAVTDSTRTVRNLVSAHIKQHDHITTDDLEFLIDLHCYTNRDTHTWIHKLTGEAGAYLYSTELVEHLTRVVGGGQVPATWAASTRTLRWLTQTHTGNVDVDRADLATKLAVGVDDPHQFVRNLELETLDAHTMAVICHTDICDSCDVQELVGLLETVWDTITFEQLTFLDHRARLNANDVACTALIGQRFANQVDERQGGKRSFGREINAVNTSPSSPHFEAACHTILSVMCCDPDDSVGYILDAIVLANPDTRGGTRRDFSVVAAELINTTLGNNLSAWQIFDRLSTNWRGTFAHLCHTSQQLATGDTTPGPADDDDDTKRRLSCAPTTTPYTP